MEDCRSKFQVSQNLKNNMNPEKPTFGKPICSMYGIFTNIYPKNHPNVGKYTIHGAFGKEQWFFNI